jgi:hypothetical protein
LPVELTPSPEAVIVTTGEPAAVDAVVNVRVEDPVSAWSVSGLPLHEAVTPAGSPLTPRLTAPVYVPFPVTVMTSVTDLPCITDAAPDTGVTISVGAERVTVIGKFWLTA